MKVMNLGSLNIDYVYQVDHFTEKGETQSSLGMQKFSGGKGLNQSVALARAGMKVVHAGAIGQEGVFLLEELRDAGVDTSLVQIRPDMQTGHAIIQVDSSGDNCILLYSGANGSVTEEEVDRAFLHFSEGDLLLLQNEVKNPPRVVEKAKARGMKVALNPSPMNEKVLELALDQVDLFLVNEVEAQQILGIPCTPQTEGEELLTKLRRHFPDAAIVLTLGENGSMYADREHMIRQEPFPVKVVDTTAAGDTFTGFFIASLFRREGPDKAMELASRAASLAIGRQGAAPSIPTMDELSTITIHN